MGRRLAAHASGGTPQPITVFGVRDAQINAFALPGGYIGVNSGLLVAAESESELASVVAPEIGHVVQRAIERGMTQRPQNHAVMMPNLGASFLAAFSGRGDVDQGSG